MCRLTRLESGFLAAALDETRRYMEKRRPDELRPGYDGETQLLGSAMLDRTQAFVRLARYDGHLSRRFFRAVKQLADLRRDERKSRPSAGSYTPADPYRGPYVPAQAPPPTDTPSPTAGRIGFRASSESAPQPGLTQNTKQTQSRRTPMKSTADCRSINARSAGGSLRSSAPGILSGLGETRLLLVGGSSFTAAWPQGPMFHQPQTTKQTQSRRCLGLAGYNMIGHREHAEAIRAWAIPSNEPAEKKKLPNKPNFLIITIDSASYMTGRSSGIERPRRWTADRRSRVGRPRTTDRGMGRGPTGGGPSLAAGEATA